MRLNILSGPMACCAILAQIASGQVTSQHRETQAVVQARDDVNKRIYLDIDVIESMEDGVFYELASADADTPSGVTVASSLQLSAIDSDRGYFAFQSNLYTFCDEHGESSNIGVSNFEIEFTLLVPSTIEFSRLEFVAARFDMPRLAEGPPSRSDWASAYVVIEDVNNGSQVFVAETILQPEEYYVSHSWFGVVNLPAGNFRLVMAGEIFGTSSKNSEVGQERGSWLTVDVQGLLDLDLTGDVNCDFRVDLLDIAPFVSLIQSGGYASKADVNLDGLVDLRDVNPFVDLIIGF